METEASPAPAHHQIARIAPEVIPLKFDNRFVQALPADPELQNYRRQVQGACYSRVVPTPVRAPTLVAAAQEVASLLSLPFEQTSSEEFAAVFSGNAIVTGMQPYASCYGGHQFGNWAGQLGDGRAISLGEVINARGTRHEIQLKGAGATPYSRSADGRAVMRSSVREYLCSEAMFHLGVPTTRALSLVATGDSVVRDMLYDGNARAEPGAVVCRVAPSFLRFGSFEIFAARGDHKTLAQLASYTLRTHFQELGAPNRESYAAMLAEIAKRTAVMVAHWMRVGFVHGVMNTDNMSVHGLTIDYGPYGWLDTYDPGWTPNTTDAVGRRYRYEHQPRVALWNLARLAEALLPLVHSQELLEHALGTFADTFESTQAEMMARKLGFETLEGERDETLLNDLFTLLAAEETDMTLFFRQLSHVDIQTECRDDELLAPLLVAYYRESGIPPYHRSETLAWLRRYQTRARRDGIPEATRKARMNSANPKYVLRNYLAQLAIERAENGDSSVVQELQEVLRRPYDEQPQFEHFAAKRPEWARSRPGCSMLSCSS